MKILYHHRTQARGAEGVHIREIVKAFEKLGNQVFVVSPPGIDIFQDIIVNSRTSNKKNKASRIWALLSKHIPEVGFEIMEITYNIIAFIKLMRILKKEQIQFIYERNAFFLWITVFLANQFKIPIILEVNEICNIKRNRKQFFKSLAQTIQVNNFNRANALVVVSNFLKDKIVSLGIVSSKIFVIPNAVNINDFNLETFANVAKVNQTSVVKLGFVGTFSWWDNLELLITVFYELTVSNKNLRLILIGDGYGDEELKNSVKKLEIEQLVTFAGRISRNEIPKFIYNMDICIIPHSNDFGSPIVLFEYLAMGKSVVAPKIGTINSVIQNNVNGLLFETGNKEEFKAKISLLVNNEELRLKLGEEARKTIIKKHLWENNAETVINIFRKLN